MDEKIIEEEPDRIKVFRLRNDKSNCGVCCCLMNEEPKENSEDVVSLCIGEYGKYGPKHNICMTVEEAQELGLALIKTKLLKEIQTYSTRLEKEREKK